MSSILRKIRGEDVFDQPALASYRNHHLLVANTNEAETVPATIGSSVVPKYVLIIPTITIFVKVGSAASIGVDVTDGTAQYMLRGGDSLLLPVSASDSINVMAESAGHVSFWYYG